MNEKNVPSYCKDRQIIGEILPLNTPFTIIIDISEVCNFKCSYCFRANDLNGIENEYNLNKQMNIDDFDTIINQILEFNSKIKKVTFSGHGEPLMHKKFPEMVRKFKDLFPNVPTEIHTNGSMLNKKLSNAIIASGLDIMNISIQGVSKKKYNEICQYDIEFDKFLSEIQYLYENKTNLNLRIKIIDVALDEDEEKIFYDLFYNKCDQIYIERYVPIFENMKNFEDTKSKNDNTQLGKNKFDIIVGDVNYCPLTFYEMIITPKGNILPCSNLEVPYVLGNIRDMTLKEAWTSEKRKMFLLNHLKQGFRCNSTCVNCYLPYNTIKTPEDFIDGYQEEIIKRIEKN